MTTAPLFSPKMGILYLILTLVGAVILNNELTLMWVILGGICLVTGVIGIYLTIIRNR